MSHNSRMTSGRIPHSHRGTKSADAFASANLLDKLKSYNLSNVAGEDVTDLTTIMSATVE